MEGLLAEHGLPALLLLSFLASTLLPLGSEWLLVALLLNGGDPSEIVAVATFGNTLGACTTYLIGRYGSDWLIDRVLRVKPAQKVRAERFYARYGAWSLLLSWLPVIGDPLCLVGALLKVRFDRYLLLVASGKLARYAVVAWLTLQSVAA